VDDENQLHADPTATHSPVEIGHLHDFMESITAQRLMDIFATGFSSLSLLVFTPSGIVVFANNVAIKAFTGETVQSVKGKHLADLAPPAWANERVKYMQLAAESSNPIPIIELLAGTRLYSLLRPVEITHHGKTETLIFITVEPISPIQLRWLREHDAGNELIMAEHIDLGRLSVLTSREIEVLALMGQGLRQKEIATKLCRSISTIDRHRERIGEKLDIKDRADLIAIAREAGLEVEDAKRTHMAMKPKLP